MKSSRLPSPSIPSCFWQLLSRPGQLTWTIFSAGKLDCGLWLEANPMPPWIFRRMVLRNKSLWIPFCGSDGHLWLEADWVGSSKSLAKRTIVFFIAGYDGNTRRTFEANNYIGHFRVTPRAIGFNRFTL